MSEHLPTDALELRSAYARLQAAYNSLAASAYRTDEALSEVEEERDQAYDDLEVATCFLVGAYRVGRRRDHWQVWGDPGLGGHAHMPDPESYATRTEALARARQLEADHEEVCR